MDPNQSRMSEVSAKSVVPPLDQSRNFTSDLSFSQFDSTFDVGSDQTFSEFTIPMQPPSLQFGQSSHDLKMGNHLDSTTSVDGLPTWDPRTMLSDLSLLEEKIHRVQGTVRAIIGRESQLSVQPNELAAQQQLVTADLTCIIIQLISTAGSLLPSIKDTLLSANPPVGQLRRSVSNDTRFGSNNHSQQNEVFSSERTKCSEHEEQKKMPNCSQGETSESVPVEDHDVKDYEDGFECENLSPGSYEVLQLEKEEILAPHTHFCLICGKGFKRDANLRMHMRGHGDEYKTPAALAKPSKEPNSQPTLIKRYSCPFVGCKRNKEHKKFQPLKTILCVKNHYKRSHCDKSYTCSRCNNKKFSVIADLKTHEKHCGRQKWLCSCGTTFSRKEKLFGHVALFQGHTPALPMDESKLSGPSDQALTSELVTGVGFNFGGSSDDLDFLDVKGVDDDSSYLSSMNFDSCNFGGFHEFPRPPFEVSENSFPFMPTTTGNYIQKNGASSSFNHLD